LKKFNFAGKLKFASIDKFVFQISELESSEEQVNKYRW